MEQRTCCDAVAGLPAYQVAEVETGVLQGIIDSLRQPGKLGPRLPAEDGEASI